MKGQLPCSDSFSVGFYWCFEAAVAPLRGCVMDLELFISGSFPVRLPKHLSHLQLKNQIPNCLQNFTERLWGKSFFFCHTCDMALKVGMLVIVHSIHHSDPDWNIIIIIMMLNVPPITVIWIAIKCCTIGTALFVDTLTFFTSTTTETTFSLIHWNISTSIGWIGVKFGTYSYDFGVSLNFHLCISSILGLLPTYLQN